MIDDNKRLSLLQLNTMVRQLIEDGMPSEYWVEAELSECRESRGHCYMELIERNDKMATPVARAQAKCWASQWAAIGPYFRRITGQNLAPGMKVLLKVYPQFHEAYGFSWIVSDIDPSYTLGDQARRRQEIINQLKSEGVFDLQRELQLPVPCLNIAVISSATAAGYGDFAAQLSDSVFNFTTQLFPATMQGEGVEKSIIAALEDVYATITNKKTQFDCVVIIRGGGATSDMSGFDTLALAENVANFPLPIITGIGHDRDECILDMVSHCRVKTPTAAAALLVENAQSLLDSIEEAQTAISRYAQQKISTASLKLENITARIPILAERLLTNHHHKLEIIAERIKMSDPQLMLKRGYSITTVNGHTLRDPKNVRAGDIIETRLEKGTLKSIIQ